MDPCGEIETHEKGKQAGILLFACFLSARDTSARSECSHPETDMM